MDRPREILIHQSCNRHNLMLGCDRELVLLSALLSAMLIFALVTWWGIVAGILLWLGAVVRSVSHGEGRSHVAARLHSAREISVVLRRQEWPAIAIAAHSSPLEVRDAVYGTSKESRRAPGPAAV
ncbi:MAG: VirB3 family type IV secretion system protein [Bryobacteraceae bacterium]